MGVSPTTKRSRFCGTTGSTLADSTDGASSTTLGLILVPMSIKVHIKIM